MEIREIINKIANVLKEQETVTGQTLIVGDRDLYTNVNDVCLDTMSFVSWWGFCRSVLGYTPDKESVTEIGNVVNRQAANRGLITLPGEATMPLSPADKRRDELLGLIQQYGYKPAPIFYGVTTNLFFGQEFEYEFTNAQDLMGFIEDLQPLHGFVYLKEDGSLTWPSVEVVTHPCSFDVAASLCRDITQAAVKHEAMVTNCGHHVHVSRRAFTEKEVSAMIETVHNCWEEVISFSGRNENEVSEFCADSFVNKHCGRYAAVNVKNKATVEVRVMKARLNVDEAVDNLTFVKMLGDTVKKSNSISLESWLRARTLAKENVQQFFARTPWTTTGVEGKEKIKDEDEDFLNWLFDQEEPRNEVIWFSENNELWYSRTANPL